ncbi:MAG: LytR C-terminal domain-containing protein, partial [Candidatus Adiutrix sp.]|nr:LytR C-terminal domain-containing protein [Candidatus Adiutrix sp.]
ESYGNAEILPPLTDAPPAKAAAPTAAKPAAAPAKQPAKQPAKATPVKTPAPKKARQAAPRAATGTLAIINETGNPRVGDIYRSVLSRLGHQVVSVAQGAAGGTPGQTVIRYAPGRRAQAQAVARQLPGKKVLTEAGSGTPDVTIYIR